MLCWPSVCKGQCPLMSPKVCQQGRRLRQWLQGPDPGRRRAGPAPAAPGPGGPARRMHAPAYRPRQPEHGHLGSRAPAARAGRDGARVGRRDRAGRQGGEPGGRRRAAGRHGADGRLHRRRRVRADGPVGARGRGRGHRRGARRPGQRHGTGPDHGGRRRRERDHGGSRGQRPGRRHRGCLCAGGSAGHPRAVRRDPGRDPRGGPDRGPCRRRGVPAQPGARPARGRRAAGGPG